MDRFVSKVLLLILTTFSGFAHALDEQLQIITATGRAVISHSDALNEAKNVALEDALYLGDILK